jgi:hypothetical protein
LGYEFNTWFRLGLITVRKPAGPPTRTTTPHTSACRTAPNTSSLFSPSITTKQTEIIPFVSQRIAQEFGKTAPKTDLALLDAKPKLAHGAIKTITVAKRACPPSI